MTPLELPAASIDRRPRRRRSPQPAL